MSSTLVRLAIAGWILFLLARAGVGAWRQRALAFTIWRRIRLRHLGGALLLFVAVSAVVIGLLTAVPPLRYGLGALVDFSGNAIFVPLEEAATRPGAPPAGSGTDWVLVAVATAFLGLLALLLPWLAFIEEEVFRAGLEDASQPRQIITALVFGAAHLIMLVPLGAALAIGVAGYVYGVVYRRAYATQDPGGVPEVAARSFRPTKRSSAAAERQRGPTSDDAFGRVTVIDRTPERRQAGAVLASTVLHTTFNTLVVALVWLSIVASAFGL